MRISKRDAAVTAIAAAVVVPYAGYLIRGSMPFIEDPRGMAAVGLMGLLVGAIVWALAAPGSFGSSRLAGTELAIAVVAFGLGIAALAFTSELLLAGFMAVVVLAWLVPVLAHGGVLPGGPARHA